MEAHDKQSVALSSIYASALLTVAKLTVGLATDSLRVLSEAAHSALDFGATVIIYFAVRVSDKPADREHPFGHGKIESVSALIETGLLFLTSLWILKGAVERLFFHSVEVKTTWYAVAVILFSIAVDWSRARALRRVAEQTGSQALEADALHFSTDILSSLVVLIGLGFVAIGWPKGDAIAALGVAVFVFHAGYDMGRRTIDVLVDTAPEGVADDVRRVVCTVPGVVRVERVRARAAGNMVPIEVGLRVSRTLPLPRVEAIRHEVANRIRFAIDRAQPLVHVHPVALDSESITDTVRIVAAAHNFLVNGIDVHEVDGLRHVELELDVDDRLSLTEAHDHATTLERAIRRDIGDDVLMTIHIEPRAIRLLKGTPVADAVLRRMKAAVREIAVTVPSVAGVRHIQAHSAPDGIAVLSVQRRYPGTGRP
ncbi:MAG: cation diffusion facilitator family transporter [Rhodospirillaceae bacterium]|nr:MAG: cation diffusion facilitator family transporter [Rhodospirillaceae bacterium]